MKLPVVVYVDCENLTEFQTFQSKISIQKRTPFKKHPNQYVACPPLSQYQREVFLRKINKNRPNTPLDIPDLSKVIPTALPHHLIKIYDSYGFFFNAFSNLKVDFASGDAGTSSLYAFHPSAPVDACTYMGGAPGMALGAYLAGAKKSWAFTGDFSFLAAGILGFNEIISRNAPIKLVIFQNGIAGATGGQDVPGRVLTAFRKAHQDLIHTISSNIQDLELIKQLEIINDADQPQVVLIDLNQ